MMVMFEDIVTLDNRSVQVVLREVDMSDLAVALKGVRPDVREKVTSNLSSRAAENLAEEIELLGPVRMSTVEEAQAKIVRVIRRLEDSGQIVIQRGDDDAFVA
jgi:flagellar motor switch protein FliG